MTVAKQVANNLRSFSITWGIGLHLFITVLILFHSSFVYAKNPIEQNMSDKPVWTSEEPDNQILAAYAEYYTELSVFRRCIDNFADDSPALGGAIADWMIRNYDDWILVRNAMMENFKSRPDELNTVIKELPDTIYQGTDGQFNDRETCLGIMKVVDDLKLHDYQIKFPELLKYLRTSQQRDP